MHKFAPAAIAAISIGTVWAANPWRPEAPAVAPDPCAQAASTRLGDTPPPSIPGAPTAQAPGQCAQLPSASGASRRDDDAPAAACAAPGSADVNPDCPPPGRAKPLQRDWSGRPLKRLAGDAAAHALA